MFCPRCAAKNENDQKYCRSCGENLSAIALVMEKRLPARLLSKLDNFLEWKNERLRRDSIVSGISGGVFLFLSVYHFVTEGLNFTVIFTLICAVILFFWGVWYYLVYQRSLSVNRREIDPQDDQAKVKPTSLLDLPAPQSSVTETTTRRLDERNHHPKS